MAFSRTWDPSYEAAPADTDDISNDAEVARNLKIDIRERLEADHSMDADDDDGKHKHVTLLDQGSDPSFDTDEVGIWNVGGELRTSVGGGTVRHVASFEPGTTMLFYQAAPPTGWTQDNTVNDRVLRMVDNTGTGAATGGSWTISGIQTDGHALTTNELPSHNHGGSTGGANANIQWKADGGSGDVGSGNDTIAGGNLINGFEAQVFTDRTFNWVGWGHGTSILRQLGHDHSIGIEGSDQAHSHGISADGTWRPSYVNIIAASKD